MNLFALKALQRYLFRKETISWLLVAGIWFVVVTLLIVPFLHWFPWWMPIAIFLCGFFSDDISTFLLGIRYGKKELLRCEQSELTARHIKRFGLMGIFISNIDHDFLLGFVLGVVLFGWPAPILAVMSLAQPYDILAIPLFVWGCIKGLAALSNIVFLFHQHDYGPHSIIRKYLLKDR